MKAKVDDDESASHFCSVCGAWWLLSGDGTWQLRSQSAGEECCNNQSMHGNRNIVSARHAVMAASNIYSSPLKAALMHAEDKVRSLTIQCEELRCEADRAWRELDAAAPAQQEPPQQSGPNWQPVPPRACIKPTREAADAFWRYWKENGETHKHGYYESTWGAINAALACGYVAPQQSEELPPVGHPLHTLGERLTHWLDDDQWNNAEPLLLEAYSLCSKDSPQQSAEPVAVVPANIGDQSGCIRWLIDEQLPVGTLLYAAPPAVHAEPVGEKRIANAIHYPACWDVAAYPELDDALAELFQAFRCQECAHPADDEAVRLLREARAMCEDGDGLIDSERLASSIDAYLAKVTK